MSCETKMINSPHANDHKSMEAPCILSTVPASSPVSLSATRTNQPFCHYVQRSLRYDSTCPTTNRDSTHAIIVWIAVGRIGELWGMGYGVWEGRRSNVKRYGQRHAHTHSTISVSAMLLHPKSPIQAGFFITYITLTSGVGRKFIV